MAAMRRGGAARQVLMCWVTAPDGGALLVAVLQWRCAAALPGSQMRVQP